MTLFPFFGGCAKNPRFLVAIAELFLGNSTFSEVRQKRTDFRDWTWTLTAGLGFAPQGDSPSTDYVVTIIEVRRESGRAVPCRYEQVTPVRRVIRAGVEPRTVLRQLSLPADRRKTVPARTQ